MQTLSHKEKMCFYNNKTGQEMFLQACPGVTTAA